MVPIGSMELPRLTWALAGRPQCGPRHILQSMCQRGRLSLQWHQERCQGPQLSMPTRLRNRKGSRSPLEAMYQTHGFRWEHEACRSMELVPGDEQGCGSSQTHTLLWATAGPHYLIQRGSRSCRGTMTQVLLEVILLALNQCRKTVPPTLM